ncbi:MAG: dTDP-4-dehydrorhamnose 3,5-epimerase [Maribacter sp.]|nr:dTDP-4-dehydrorhamnose 3,5-epimerase [Maribacter sp.]
MKVTETHLKGCFIIEPKVFDDERGVFFESYQKERFEEAIGEKVDFVQSNFSVSKQGVLRGLHFQIGKNAQAKLVQVAKGEVLDVIVDLRANSKTFGQHYKQKLSEQNNMLIFIPKGMAHGFLTLSKEAVFTYKCDNYYDKSSEGGIIYNDIDLNIDWGYTNSEIIISKKDSELPTFKELYP